MIYTNIGILIAGDCKCMPTIDVYYKDGSSLLSTGFNWNRSSKLFLIDLCSAKGHMAANLRRKDVGYLRHFSGVQFFRFTEARRVDAFGSHLHSIRKTIGLAD